MSPGFWSATPVDGDQGAVEDRVGEQPDPGHGRGQVVGGRGEQVDGLADVTPGGRDADLESGGQAGQSGCRRCADGPGRAGLAGRGRGVATGTVAAGGGFG
jgi:hypothetical protein